MDETEDITGVTYINKLIPKLNKKTKSLYLEVNDEKIIPKPIANPAIKSNKKGVAKTQILGCIFFLTKV